jgi:hypothetical protein
MEQMMLIYRTKKIITLKTEVVLEGSRVDGLEVNIITLKTEVVLENSREDGLEVNAEKMKYRLMSRYQNAEQNRTSNVAKLKYFGTAVTNQICIHEDIKS